MGESASNGVSFEGLEHERCETLPPYPYHHIALKQISRICARAWQVCPLDYDADASPARLTLAIHLPQQADVVRRRLAFMQHPAEPVFILAPRTEVVSALEAYYTGTRPPPENAPHPVKRSSPGEDTRDGPPRPVLSQTVAQLPHALRERRGTGSAVELLSDSLACYVRVLVDERLADDPAQRAALSCRIWRLERLLTRLDISDAATRATLMRAWRDPLRAQPEILARLRSPDPVSDNETNAVASALLSVVDAIEEQERKVGAKAIHEPERLRACLEVGGDLLAALCEEATLLALGRDLDAERAALAGRRVLLVMSGPAAHPLAHALDILGLEVYHVEDGEAAWAVVERRLPDCVVVGEDQVGNGIQALCGRLRNDSRTRSIPFALFADSRHAPPPASLLSEVDDVLDPDLNPLVLELKLRRLIERSALSEPVEIGFVSGDFRLVSFADMLQVLCAAGRDMSVMLQRETDQGRIDLVGGAVIHAETNSLTGDLAFYVMMHWDDAVFVVRDVPETLTHSIEAPLMTLLMEGSRRKDENAEGKS